MRTSRMYVIEEWMCIAVVALFVFFRSDFLYITIISFTSVACGILALYFDNLERRRERREKQDE